MTSPSSAPRLWPHVLIAEGPPIAGLAAGDRVAFAPDDWLFLRSFYWNDARRAIAIESTPFGHTNGDAWRVKSADGSQPRIEYIDYGGRLGRAMAARPG